MRICPVCNTMVEDDAMFCYNCGTRFMPATPEPPRPSIGKAITSLALGVVAFIFALYSFLYSFVFMSSPLIAVEAGLIVYNLIMAIFILPLSIVSMVLASGYLNGNPIKLKPMAITGRVLSLISIIEIGVMLFVIIIR